MDNLEIATKILGDVIINWIINKKLFFQCKERIPEV